MNNNYNNQFNNNYNNQNMNMNSNPNADMNSNPNINNGNNQDNSLAIVGFVLSFIPLLSIVGLILSIIGLKNSKKMNGKYKGFAIAGIIISSIYLFIISIALIFTLFIWPDVRNNIVNDTYNTDYYITSTTTTEPKTTTTITKTVEPSIEDAKVIMYIFYGDGCPHCAELEEYLKNTLKKDKNYNKKFKTVYFEVWYDKDNSRLMEQVGKHFNYNITGVPFIVIGNKYFSGYGESMNDEIKSAIDNAYNSTEDTDIITQIEEEYNITSFETDPENNYSIN